MGWIRRRRGLGGRQKTLRKVSDALDENPYVSQKRFNSIVSRVSANPKLAEAVRTLGGQAPKRQAPLFLAQVMERQRLRPVLSKLPIASRRELAQLETELLKEPDAPTQARLQGRVDEILGAAEDRRELKKRVQLLPGGNKVYSTVWEAFKTMGFPRKRAEQMALECASKLFKRDAFIYVEGRVREVEETFNTWGQQHVLKLSIACKGGNFVAKATIRTIYTRK